MPKAPCPDASKMLLLGLIAITGCGGRPDPAPVSRDDRVPTPAAGSTVVPDPPPSPIASPSPTTEPARVVPALATIGPGDPGVQLAVEVPGDRGAIADWTDRACWRAEPEGVVAIDTRGFARPIGPGRVTIHAGLSEAGDEVEATLIVAGTEADRPWDFAEDVVPILTRAGCNAGGCHGRAEGRGGFHLSFLGYDSEGDHRALTREAGGRRIDPIAPESSLILRKATGRTPHGGGLRVVAGSPDYEVLRAWIAAGGPSTRGETHGELVALEVRPAEVRLDEPGPVQLRAVARFEDGHERDVSRLASYRTLDEGAATVEVDGRATLLRRAEVDLIVRYQSKVVAVRVAAPINPDLDLDFTSLSRANFIDDALYRRLESLRVPPSPPAADAAFLRRVSLDLTGEQPLPDKIRRFLADDDPEKCSRLVDELLASRDFERFWQIKLGDLLGITPARFNNGAYAYEAWLGERLAENTRWDALVRELLTAVGDPMVRGGGPVNYALDGPDPKVRAERTAQRFLGLRIRCAQCHDHPFDIWTQDDYFGLAAIFAKVGPAGPAAPGMGRMQIGVNPEGSIEHLRTKRPALPRLLDGSAVEVEPEDDPRAALADWMTAPDNPYFARSLANWAWAQFFGRGLADPPDDLSRSNPPVHPELLDALARHLVESGFDLRDLVRTIATSNAYGFSSATIPGNARDSRLFSHQMPRPLTAHQMADALAQATDIPNLYGDRGSRALRRAIEVHDPTVTSTILDTFGRCARVDGCAAVPTPPLSLRQSLLLIGGDAIESKVAALNGYLADMLGLDPAPDEVVENLYLRTVCRPPTAEESSRWSAELSTAPSLREAAEDLFWALLNSREFAFNH